MVYLHVALFGAAVVSSFWAMVNERFDPHTARHSMGRIGSGASVGGVLGAAATWRALRPGAGERPAPGHRRPARRGRADDGAPRARGSGGAAAGGAAGGGEAEAGWRVLAAMPYLRSLAALVALCALMEALLDYAFSAAAVARFGRGEGLVAFFAAFHVTTGVLSLAVQAVLVRGLLARVGLAGTLTVHSLGVAVLAGVAAAVPRAGALIVLRAAEAVLRHSTFRSAYELFYTPLPPQQKRPAKPLVDVGADRVGTLAGSIATAGVVAVAGHHTSSVLVLLALASALGMVALAWRLHRGYVTALGDSLRAGVVRVEASEVVDATTLHTVQDFRPARPAVPEVQAAPPPVARPIDPERAREEDLRSGDAARIRAVLSEAVLDPALVAIAMPLLGARRPVRRGRPGLPPRRPALHGPAHRRAARPGGGAGAAPAHSTRAGLGADPARGRRPARRPGERPARRALPLGPGPRPPPPARGGAPSRGDPLRPGRARDRRATGPGGARFDHVFALLSLALDGEPMAIALRALRGSDPGLRGTALEYLDHVLPARIRAALWPRLGVTAAETASRRTVDEVRGELLASSWHATAAERRMRNSAAG